MKKTLTFCVMLIATASMLKAQPSTFNFTANSAFGGIIATVEVNGKPASGSDWIAAFDEADNCAGAIQLVENDGQAYCNLLIYGNDATTTDVDEGIDTEETFTFKLWQAATDKMFDHPMSIEPVEGWEAGLNGTTISGWDFADGKQINFDIETSITTVSTYDDSISVFPNPAIDKANIMFNLTKYDKITAALVDATGKQLISVLENETRQAGEHRIKLNVNDLASGIYYLKVQEGKENNTISKLIIHK